jgi:hypothetical protein
MQNFSILKKVVYVESLDFKGLSEATFEPFWRNIQSSVARLNINGGVKIQSHLLNQFRVLPSCSILPSKDEVWCNSRLKGR